MSTTHHESSRPRPRIQGVPGRRFAFALALVVAGCTPVASPTPRPVEPGPTGTPVPTTSTVPSPSLTAHATPGQNPTPLPTPAWRRVAENAIEPEAFAGSGAAVEAAAWLNDRWIAIGQGADGIAAWWSIDGITWQTATIDDRDGPVPRTTTLVVGHGVAVAAGFTNATFRGVVSLPDAPDWRDGPWLGASLASTRQGSRAAGPVSMAVGACSPIRTADAGVMTTSDGATWRTVPPAAALDGQPMLALAVTDEGFVAAGGTIDDEGLGRSAAWTSPDGRAWTRSPDAPALRSGIVSRLAVVDQAIVGLGAHDCNGGDGVMWTSIDGRTWGFERDASVLGGDAVDLVANGSRAVLLASQGESRTTTDGVGWTSYEVPLDLFHHWLAALPDGFLAIRDQATGIWASPDGAAWTFVPLDGGCVVAAAGPGATLCIEDADVTLGPPTIAAILGL